MTKNLMRLGKLAPEEKNWLLVLASWNNSVVKTCKLGRLLTSLEHDDSDISYLLLSSEELLARSRYFSKFGIIVPGELELLAKLEELCREQ